ncbi:hypothetical protein H0274_01760 [Altererythrobacter sp. CC-YST694]|uniref:hypothetical protein n=1 Tax=Altererythrobacter sp. CC-YST694 TaxID=2755038 RepID=UPI001D027796|nr:hypothetical protein [Altererythrobacter sp. CC-YST694]MCB5423971.1 hypothetical protein [Altererythrobacter sp. CC-YST694]
MSVANNENKSSLSNARRSYLERSIEHNVAEMRHRSEVGNQLGQATLKSLMLVNGGAIISLLTFIGNKGAVAHPELIKDAMLCFGFGIFTTLIAYFCAYFSQNAFLFYASAVSENGNRELSDDTPEYDPDLYLRRGNKALYGAIALSVISLSCFIGGALTAVNAIL